MIECLLTIAGYAISYAFYKKYQKPWFNPLYTTTLLVIGMLYLFHIDTQAYVNNTSFLNFLLGTATVSLAIPLYKQVKIIKKKLSLILIGVITGTLTGILTVVVISQILHLDKALLYSLLPKSVTIPIALSVSNSLGGVPSLTVLFVVISGIFSLLAAPTLMNRIGIQSKTAKGLALGTSAQALGASRALELGEYEGAIGSAAMSVSALIMSIFSPFLFFLSYL